MEHSECTVIVSEGFERTFLGNVVKLSRRCFDVLYHFLYLYQKLIINT